MKRIKVTIEGMHCANCVTNIEKSVKKIPGVKTVSVSALTKKGFIEAEDNVAEEDIKKAVARAGYKIISFG